MWDSCHPHNSESTKSVADDRDTDLVIIPKFIQWNIANLSMFACSSFQVAAYHWYSQWIYPSQAIQEQTEGAVDEMENEQQHQGSSRKSKAINETTYHRLGFSCLGVHVSL